MALRGRTLFYQKDTKGGLNDGIYDGVKKKENKEITELLTGMREEMM